MGQAEDVSELLRPLLARIRERNDQAGINEVLSLLAKAAAYIVVGTDVPVAPRDIFRLCSMSLWKR
jgi:hypothetical protein